jgi:isopentenyl-diphosphate delta-isomerase
MSSDQRLVDIIHRDRKDQHIDICAKQDVQHTERKNGFESIQLPVCSLPEINWDSVNTKAKIFGREFSWPVLITGMTGGVTMATTINHRLAGAASAFGIPMGVGSQRIAIENPSLESVFKLKQNHPKLFLIANLGVSQLQGPSFVKDARQAVDMIEADALAIHVNVLQELIQVEGDRNFSGLIQKIGELKESLKCPVMVKEVGAGLDPKTIQSLYNLGIRTFDVGGSGGTSWAHIEGLRSNDPTASRLGHTFRNWGLSTAEALSQAVSLGLRDVSYIATGGMRDGLAVCKAVYRGAAVAGIGLPLFQAALISEEAVCQELEVITKEFKIASIVSGLAR